MTKKVDKGTEWLYPWAVKKVKELRAHIARTGMPVIRKRYPIGGVTVDLVVWPYTEHIRLSGGAATIYMTAIKPGVPPVSGRVYTTELWKSTDSGKTWVMIDFPDGLNSVLNVQCFGRGKVYFSSYYTPPCYTTDGGTTFLPITSLLPASPPLPNTYIDPTFNGGRLNRFSPTEFFQLWADGWTSVRVLKYSDFTTAPVVIESSDIAFASGFSYATPKVAGDKAIISVAIGTSADPVTTRPFGISADGRTWSVSDFGGYVYIAGKNGFLLATDGDFIYRTEDYGASFTKVLNYATASGTDTEVLWFSSGVVRMWSAGLSLSSPNGQIVSKDNGLTWEDAPAMEFSPMVSGAAMGFLRAISATEAVGIAYALRDGKYAPQVWTTKDSGANWALQKDFGVDAVLPSRLILDVGVDTTSGGWDRELGA